MYLVQHCVRLSAPVFCSRAFADCRNAAVLIRMVTTTAAKPATWMSRSV